MAKKTPGANDTQQTPPPAAPANGQTPEAHSPTGALILTALVLFTVIGSLYVSLAGHRSRIEVQRARAERERWELVLEISALQVDLAEKETYRRIREEAVRRGMVETKLDECWYLGLTDGLALSSFGGAGELGAGPASGRR